ncbi:CRISPR-associated endonuclease Cas3'' [Kitasatospora sp. NPDC091335]|uniref:CRISPR-associated endonuclease Cas3'' n=1 Tax=Kitasatospora sp. NPDC091335 TaxID=3364085 RepID=UPI0038109E65
MNIGDFVPDFTSKWALDGVLWSKEDGLPDGLTYPLFAHLLDTAAVCLALWDLYMSEGQQRMFTAGLGLEPDSDTDRERAGSLLACWAGWHDLGKIGAYFQVKVPAEFAQLRGYPPLSSEARGLSHGEATQLYLAVRLPSHGYDGGDGLPAASPARRLAQLLGGHHGRVFPQPNRNRLRHPSLVIRMLGEGRWEEQRLAHLTAVAQAVGDPDPPEVLSVEAAVLAGEMVVLADWLASQLPFVIDQLEHLSEPGDPALVVRHWEQAVAAGPGLVEDAGLGLPVWKETPVS